MTPSQSQPEFIRYYPITEEEISLFVRSSVCMDRTTRSLAQKIYSRQLVSLSNEAELIKNLEYEIYKLKKNSAAGNAEKVLEEIEKLPIHVNENEPFSISFVYKYELDKKIAELRVAGGGEG